MLNQKTITVAITGASGFRYAIRLVECLLQANCRVYLLVTEAARAVAVLEDSIKLHGQTHKLAEQLQTQFKVSPEQLQVFAEHEWTAPIASGSAFVDAMVVCPCSSAALAAIATGASNNLFERAADVMLKEQRKLVLVHRETPISAIHLENMLKLAKLGVVILPASPGFYHQPKSINDLVDFIVARILNCIGIANNLVIPWAG